MYRSLLEESYIDGYIEGYIEGYIIGFIEGYIKCMILPNMEVDIKMFLPRINIKL